MGLDHNFGHAFAKAQMATGTSIPLQGNVFISVKDKDKNFILEICKKLINFGYEINCTTFIRLHTCNLRYLDK